PAQQPVQRQRQQRRLVAPVFEQLARTAVGGGVEQRRRVRAEAAVQRQVVGALQDVDRVHLEQPGPAQHPAQVPAVGRTAGRRIGTRPSGTPASATTGSGSGRTAACTGRSARSPRSTSTRPTGVPGPAARSWTPLAGGWSSAASPPSGYGCSPRTTRLAGSTSGPASFPTEPPPGTRSAGPTGRS